MQLSFTKRFLRGFHTLSQEQRERVLRALALFEREPFHPLLRNHPLKGKWRGVCAISAGFDLRILFREEKGSSIAILIMVGTHDEVY